MSRQSAGGSVLDIAPSPWSAIPTWAGAMAPPPALTVAEWAQLHRLLPEASAAKGARWDNRTAPYLVEPMNAVLAPGTRTVTIKKAAQCGASEALNNVLGYLIQHEPAPVLLVHPTAGAAEAFSKERLADMIRSSPALRSRVQDKRQTAEERAESTLALKLFPGGYLALGGANSPNTFARWAVRVAIGDDFDRFPPTLGAEGEPADLLRNRTVTFHDGVTVFVSTPTLTRGPIDTLYGRSDQRRWVIPCPACAAATWVTWQGHDTPEAAKADAAPVRWSVRWDDGEPASARLQCPRCPHTVRESGRAAWVGSGRWVPTARPMEPGAVGFHVPAMLSPFVTLADLVARWQAARARGREALRVFVNTMLAEGWDDQGARLEPDGLRQRVEPYGKFPDGGQVEVPAPVVVVTAAVDVQADRVELLVLGHGPERERWVLDAATIPGALDHAQVQADLLARLRARYWHAQGTQLPIHATAIDSGYLADTVYALVRQHGGTLRLYATKGVAGKAGEPLVMRAKDQRLGRQRVGRVWLVNVDDAKADLFASLPLPAGPGAIHFPDHVPMLTDEWFAQLVGEHREPKYNRSGVATQGPWVQHRERNEALDLMVLATAALTILNPRFAEWQAALALARPDRPTAAPAPPPPPPKAPPPFAPPRWLGDRPRGGWLR